MKTGRLPALLVAAAALSIAGCGERAEPRGSLGQPYPVSVQGAGDQPTVLGQRPERIVVLDPGSAELLVALGAGSRLAGVPTGLEETSIEAAEEVVRATGQIDVEAVIKRKPDLIVATPATDQVDLARAERESGAAVYVQPAGSVDGVERGAIQLGFLVGEAPRARKLVGSIRRAVAEVEARLTDVETVSVFIDTGFLITVPERSLLGDLVRRAGGESVAEPNPGPDPFEPCEVARLDPDVLLVVHEAGGLAPSPDFSGCKGARAGKIQVVQVDAKLVARPGPRVPDGLEAVARVLHPDAFR